VIHKKRNYRQGGRIEEAMGVERSPFTDETVENKNAPKTKIVTKGWVSNPLPPERCARKTGCADKMDKNVPRGESTRVKIKLRRGA